MDKRVIFLFLLILIIGLALRGLTIKYNNLMESDSYSYLSVIKQTLANNLTIISNLSGFPNHNQFDESSGLILISAIPSYIFNINPIILVIYLPFIFGAIEIIEVYIITWQLSKNKWAALIAMFLFAITASSIFRSSIGEYRGDSFSPAFVGLAIIFTIQWIKDKKDIHIIPILLSILATYWVWNGGDYILAILIGFIIMLLTYQITKSKLKAILAATILIIIGTLSLGYLGIILPISGVDIAEIQPASLGFLIVAHGVELILGLYGIIYLVFKDKMNEKIVFLIYSLFLVTFILEIIQIRFETLLAMPLAILSGYGLYKLIEKNYSENKTITIGAIATIFILQLIITTYPVLSFKPAENINPQFIEALNYLNKSTPINSTVLTLWTEGSLVEAIGNRQASSDSVMGLINNQTIPFGKWLLNRNGNFSYLKSKDPNYILIRKYWINEQNAIAYESNITDNYKGSNLQALENKSINLTIAYQNNDTIIYRYKNGG